MVSEAILCSFSISWFKAGLVWCGICVRDNFDVEVLKGVSDVHYLVCFSFFYLFRHKISLHLHCFHFMPG